MRKRLLQYVRKYYNLVIKSIAFYPALISLAFLLVSYLMLTIDFSPYGKSIKSQWDFLTLKDASTARTIAATIAAGILSLTVFSFSMVMIMLNQAASNMSNRVLDSMIGNRFQQWVLGFYIGTIVYALFLLSTIRDIDSGIYVPALSVYLLILLTVVDIFLFIYFLHYVTQSVKYEVIIERIHRQTRQKLEQQLPLRQVPGEVLPLLVQAHEVKMLTSGYFQGFDHKRLVEYSARKNWIFAFLYPVGTFILQGRPFAKVLSPQPITHEEYDQIQLLVDFYRGEPIASNPLYGCKQLVEVAIKALSPGINDPGTAVLSLHVLVDLLSFYLTHFSHHLFYDEEGGLRIVTEETTFQEIFQSTLLPIWDYGKEDRILREAMEQILKQLLEQVPEGENKEVINALWLRVRAQEAMQPY
ncbi:hypothetical protein TH63_01855 [Rufibacter radiotolerans]|uniref:DUF2254 domain-containing protein n=1 Tax=Rufibacter radiotolerans TaxID=1379910 RepID=A0A0H4VGD7_9BACT|nr:DUF2254 domain-containing protein [Rufibacter radiotolerans]AKQ44655.1 hypothetical protein TH63_01855 [Rufibacter radiotolerans]